MREERRKKRESMVNEVKNKKQKIPGAVEFNVLCNLKGERQSGTRVQEQRKVKKRCGEKQSSNKRIEEAEDFDRLLVLRRDCCQRRGERHRLYGQFVAETD